MWTAILLAAAGVSGPVRAAAADLAGVRSTSPAIRELIDDAMWESPTFRGIVRAIGATDGIVYVEQGVCRHGVHACLLLDVTPAAGYRILHILVDRQGVLAHRGRLDLIATIGHELTHALEVLGERTIRSAAAMFLFYVHQAPTSQPHLRNRGRHRRRGGRSGTSWAATSRSSSSRSRSISDNDNNRFTGPRGPRGPEVLRSEACC